MRKLILYMFTTLDGFIAGPNGEFDDYEPGPDEMAFANALFGASGGILFGRVIYEGFVSYWDTLDLASPTVSPLDAEYARIFRRLDKAVVSRTLDPAGVGQKTLLIRDDVAANVSRLKAQSGGDLLLICGPELLAALLRYDLVDECMLLVKPSVLGRGRALFDGAPGKVPLTLLSTRVFASGAVLLHYQLARAGALPA